MFERWMARMLMQKAGAGGGSGGSAGGGNDDDDGDEKFTKRFNELFHAAMKGERKKIAKDIAEDLAPSFAEMIGKNVGDAFTAYEAKQAEKAKAAGGGDGAGAGGTGGAGGAGGAGSSAATTELERQVKAMQAEHEKLQRKLQEEADKRKAAEHKALREEEYNALRDGLTERGARKALIPQVLPYLHGKLVRDPKSGTILFKDGDDELDLGKGLDKYIESEAGQELLPPRDVGGSGDRGAGRGAKGKQEMDHAAFADKMFGGGGA